VLKHAVTEDIAIARQPIQPALQDLDLAADMQQQTANESVSCHIDEGTERQADKLVRVSQVIHRPGRVVIIGQPSSIRQFSLSEDRQQGCHRDARAGNLHQDRPPECFSTER